jgi:hypothetical protein
VREGELHERVYRVDDERQYGHNNGATEPDECGVSRVARLLRRERVSRFIEDPLLRDGGRERRPRVPNRIRRVQGCGLLSVMPAPRANSD